MLLIGCSNNDDNNHSEEQNVLEERQEEEEKQLEYYREQQELAKENSDIMTDAVKEKVNERVDDLFTEVENRDREAKYSVEEIIYLTLYRFYYDIKNNALVIGLFSFFIGGLMFLLCNGNRGWKKFGLWGLMIGIPVILVIFVFGGAYYFRLYQ